MSNLPSSWIVSKTKGRGSFKWRQTMQPNSKILESIINSSASRSLSAWAQALRRIRLTIAVSAIIRAAFRPCQMGKRPIFLGVNSSRCAWTLLRKSKTSTVKTNFIAYQAGCQHRTPLSRTRNRRKTSLNFKQIQWTSAHLTLAEFSYSLIGYNLALLKSKSALRSSFQTQTLKFWQFLRWSLSRLLSAVFYLENRTKLPLIFPQVASSLLTVKKG